MISLGLSFLVANFLGRKRQIGFNWSIFFCITLSPLGGFLITIFSNKSSADSPEPSKVTRIIGWIIILISVIAMSDSMFNPNFSSVERISRLTIQFGIAAYGYFLTLRANGERFDKKS